MPTYSYFCERCEKSFTAMHSVSAEKPPCPVCKGKVERRILSPPATHGRMARGRELAMRSLETSKDKSGHGHKHSH